MVEVRTVAQGCIWTIGKYDWRRTTVVLYGANKVQKVSYNTGRVRMKSREGRGHKDERGQER